MTGFRASLSNDAGARSVAGRRNAYEDRDLGGWRDGLRRRPGLKNRDRLSAPLAPQTEEDSIMTEVAVQIPGEIAVVR